MIIGYFGFNGSGKTLSMNKALTEYDTVFSNFGYNGIPGQKICTLTTCEDLFDILQHYTDLIGVGREKIALAIDEAGLNFPARSWKNISKREAYLFAQHRKIGIDFLYTAQNAKMIDSILRNNTAMCCYPRHFFSLFWQAWYEGTERTKDLFLTRDIYWGSQYYKLYNTLEVVESTKFYTQTEEKGEIDWGNAFKMGVKK